MSTTEYVGAADLAVAAAVDYVLPIDWYAGDRRATAQLQRAEELADTEEQIFRLRAARAMAEMRIPVPTGDAQQVAWVTRPMTHLNEVLIVLMKPGCSHCWVGEPPIAIRSSESVVEKYQLKPLILPNGCGIRAGWWTPQ